VRALACAFVLLILPAAAIAGPARNFAGSDSYLVGSGEPRLRIPGEMPFHADPRARHPDDMLAVGLQSSTIDGQSPASGLSFGPLHAESELVNGKRRMHYRIDGFSLMGGQIGASLSSRHAILTLHWNGIGD